MLLAFHELQTAVIVSSHPRTIPICCRTPPPILQPHCRLHTATSPPPNYHLTAAHTATSLPPTLPPHCLHTHGLPTAAHSQHGMHII